MINAEWDESDDMPDMQECPSCNGSGSFTVGDCEDGVEDECPECQGSGQIEAGDIFIPERDAWTAND